MTGFLARMVLRSLVARFRRSLVTVLAVALAVASLVVLYALMVGVSDAMVRNTVALGTGHVLLRGNFDMNRNMRLLAERFNFTALPRRHAQAEREDNGAITRWPLIGVRPDLERGRSVVAAKITDGSFLDAPGTIVLGAAFNYRLGATIGENLTVTVNGRPRTFRVGGLFRTGVDRLDSAAFVNIDDLDGPIDEVAIFIENPADAADADYCRTVGMFANTYGQARPEDLMNDIHTWRDLLPELVQILALNRVSMNIVLVLATVILAMGVSNATFISASERTREFGILKAMGMRPATIALLVTCEAAGLAVVGAAAGLAVGACAAGVWSRAGLDLSAWTSENVHFLVSGVVYPRLAARALVLPFVAATAFAVASALLPAMRAARVRAVEALRWI